MKPIKYLLLLIFFINSAISAQNTFLWRIESPKKTYVSYMMGTNHTLTSTYVDQFSIIKEKMKQAEVVVFEVDLIDKEGRKEKYLDSLPENNELKEIFSEEQKEKLRKRFGENILKASPLQLYGMLSGAHQAAEVDSLKKDKKKSQWIETYLIKMAVEEGKNIVYLETIEEQLEVVSKMKPSFLVYGLMKKSLPGMVDNLDDPNRKNIKKKETKKAVDDYYGQETKYYLNKKCRGQYWQNLLVKRNEKWLEALPKILNEKNMFMSVGSQHLMYECGMVTQLKKLGYKLTPIDMKTGKDLPFDNK